MLQRGPTLSCQAILKIFSTLLAKLALLSMGFEVVAPDCVTPSSCTARGEEEMVPDVLLPAIVMLDAAISVLSLAAMVV